MKTLAIIGLSAALIAALVATANAEPSIYPTGVTRYNPAKAHNVLILFSGPPPR
jgi:hypothetical protein